MARADRKNRTEPTRSAEKTIVSIRMPVEVLEFVEREARARAAGLGLNGEDLDAAINITATINRTLEAIRSWFALPSVVVDALESDRDALGLGRVDYLQYLAFRRYAALVKSGPGFDKGGTAGEKATATRR